MFATTGRSIGLLLLGFWGSFQGVAQPLTSVESDQSPAAMYRDYAAAEDWQGMATSANTWGEQLMRKMRIDSAVLQFEHTLALPPKQLKSATRAYAYDMLSQIANIRGQHQEALQHGLAAMRLYRQTADMENYHTSILHIGSQYQLLNQNDSAEHYLKKSIELLQQSANAEGLATAYNHLGMLYGNISETDRSVDAYLAGLAYAEKSDKPSYTFHLLINLCQQFNVLQLYDQAQEYAERARALADAHDNPYDRIKARMRLGQIAELTNDYSAAEGYYTGALERFERLGNRPGQLGTLLSLNNVLLVQQKAEALETPLRRQAELLEQVGKPRDRVLHLLQQARWLHLRNDYTHAVPLIEESIALADSIEHLQYQLNGIQLLAATHNRLGNYSRAYGYLQESTTLQDTINHRARQEYVQEMEARYHRAQQDREIDRLQYEARLGELDLADTRRQRTLWSGGATLALALAGMGFYLFWDRRKTSRQLARQNSVIEQALAEKELLLREIHHRVKNNLQVISSLLNLQSRYIDDPQAVRAINEGRTRVRSMALIHQNLYQQDDLTGVPVQEYLSKLLLELFDTYRIDRSRIELQTDIAPVILDVDTVVPLGLILNELVSNALKYAFPDERQGMLAIALWQEAAAIRVRVADTGIGMTGVDLMAEPTTFGYRLIRALAAKLEAELKVDSHPTTGTTVELTFQEVVDPA